MSRRAFSMIEILIAVVVLSIGLLGIAISLPATISIQRRGSDATRAVTAASAAKAYIETRPDLNRLHTWEATGRDPFPPRLPVGLGTLVEDKSWSADFQWDIDNSGEIEVSGEDAGRMEFQDTGNNSGVPVYINVGDRLWPAPSTGMRPEFVWDFVARRLPSRSAAASVSPRIQVALFVRRIDPGIRTPRDATLYQVLTGRPTAVRPSDRRVPVAVLNNAGDVLPRMNGQGDYALPLTLDVQYDPVDPGRIEITDLSNPSKVLVATRPGQRFVDNLGNVYRVLRTAEDNPNIVVVDPPVPSWVQRTRGRQRPDQIFQIVLTPQTPVTVEVFDLTLTDPVGSPTGSGVGGRLP